jgi:beta-1,3-galactosyltransferase 1
MTIRETWGSVAKTNKEVKLIFMLGQTLNAQVQYQINSESSHFHDIVQEDFLDSYKNLSLKSAAMLKWSYAYCPSAKYTLKADDDMFVNIEYLLKVLKLRTLTNTVIGKQITGAQPVQDNNSKWYTPRGMFNGTVYPSYCSGTSYVISGDAIGRLYNTTLVTPCFWLEDVYITGICRTKANVKIFDDYGFSYTKPTATGCVFRKRITGHKYNEREIRKIWKEFTNSSLKC